MVPPLPDDHDRVVETEAVSLLPIGSRSGVQSWSLRSARAARRARSHPPGGGRRPGAAPPHSKATTSAARADKTTRRHGRASQGRAAGAGRGRRPIGNGGGGHGDLLEDGEAAPQTTAAHTTDFRQSTINPAARFPIGVPDPQQLPLGVTCPPHQASAAEAGLVHLCVWWKAVREDRSPVLVLALAPRQDWLCSWRPGWVGFRSAPSAVVPASARLATLA
jgi:hypothetical protein